MSATLKSDPQNESKWVLVLVVLTVVAWTLYAGKDITWDLYNHHLYLPFSLLSGRHATDLFAAGPQSYQNPVGYVPFYLMALSPMPAWLVGVCLAVAHGVLIGWPLQRITVTVFNGDRDQRSWRLLALGMGLSAPIFLMMAGTSSTDPLCAGLILIAIAVVLDPKPQAGLACLGGVALGLAVAIKPTSGIFAVPLLPVAAIRLWQGTATWRATAVFATTALMAVLLLAGPWAWWLWRSYGNPVFPLFNQFFQSPLAPMQAIVATRFLPENPTDWIFRLWDIALFKPYTSTEAFMPDARPVVAAVVGLACLGLLTARHGWRAWVRASTWRRADAQLALIVALSYVLWLGSSGNSRYGIAWFILVGLALVRVVQVCFRSSRLAPMALLLVMGLQVVGFVAAADIRTGGVTWDSRPYLPVEVPKRLVDEPFLHLSLSSLANAAIAPSLHVDGALVNLVGHMSLPTDGPLGGRLQELLQRWRGKTRVLMPQRLTSDTVNVAEIVGAESWALSHRIGLEIDPTDCLTIKFPLSEIKLDNGKKMDLKPIGLLSCATKEHRRLDPQLDEDLARANEVFKVLEAECPRYFGPTPMASDYNPLVIWRRYANSDARIAVSHVDGVLLSHFRAANPVYLGTAQQVIESNGSKACKAWQALSMQ